MMSPYTIGEICNNGWIEVARLVAQAIPNALISKLGSRFGAAFYSKLVEQEYSCGYVARNGSGNVVGVIIGSTDYPKARSTALKGQLLKLVMAANFRLLRWSVIRWIISGVLTRAKDKKQEHANRPIAELVAIGVCHEARGTGLSQELVKAMEKFMVSKGLGEPYVILTEKANKRANKFYEKIGAKFVRTNLYHGREINEWRRKITGAKQGG